MRAAKFILQLNHLLVFTHLSTDNVLSLPPSPVPPHTPSPSILLLHCAFLINPNIYFHSLFLSLHEHLLLKFVTFIRAFKNCKKYLYTLYMYIGIANVCIWIRRRDIVLCCKCKCFCMYVCALNQVLVYCCFESFLFQYSPDMTHLTGDVYK